jgi:DNA-binding response OmpR family regulator
MAMRKVIIVIDDDPSMLRGLTRLLRADGFDVDTFTSADRFYCSPEAVCIILDIHLNGQSGIEFSRRLTESGILLPTIFITADDSEATRKLALESGCIAYLTKPFAAEALLAALPRTP